MSLLCNVDIYSILVLAILLIPAYLIYAKNKRQSLSLDPQEALKQAGGFIPYIKKLHSEQGAIASYGLPMPNAISCIDTAVMKATLSCGNRPKELLPNRYRAPAPPTGATVFVQIKLLQFGRIAALSRAGR